MGEKLHSVPRRLGLAILATLAFVTLSGERVEAGDCAMCPPGACRSQTHCGNQYCDGGSQYGGGQQQYGCSACGGSQQCNGMGQGGPWGGQQGPYGGSGILPGTDWFERPYAPGLYWIGPDSHWRRPCPQLYGFLPGIYKPVYMGNLPRWYASAEYLALFRDEDETVAFASRGADPNRIPLSTAKFNADYQSGVRTVIGWQYNDHIRIEGSYFGSYTWQDQASVDNVEANELGGVGNLFSPFSNFGNPVPIPAVDYNTLAAIEYRSRLNSVELNLRHRLLVPPAPFEASVLLGARYMNVDETFGYLTVNEGGDRVTLDVDTSNEMIGVQMGLLGQWLLTPWAWLDWDMKGAIASNTAGQSTIFVERNGETFLGARDEITTSFIGETSLVLNYQFKPSITFRVGYNALWVTGLALADQNFETNRATLRRPSRARLHHSADTVYHGFNIGVVIAR